MSLNLDDFQTLYTGNEIRLALLLAAKQFSEAKPALLKAAWHLGLAENGEIPVTPMGGWRTDVPMVRQRCRVR